jgi:hypothetical protein
MLLLVVGLLCAALRSEELDSDASTAGTGAGPLSLLRAEADGFQLAPAPARGVSSLMRAAQSRAPAAKMVEMNVILGAGGLVFGTAAGVGLIAAVEGAGKKNSEEDPNRPCFDCKGQKVVECVVCKGTGQDQFASLVQGVKEMSGEDTNSGPMTVLIDDWDSGPKEVVPFEQLLGKYPIKVKTDICITCDGRGVVVCDSCEGNGLQGRFLDRYSPDDFMD